MSVSHLANLSGAVGKCNVLAIATGSKQSMRRRGKDVEAVNCEAAGLNLDLVSEILVWACERRLGRAKMAPILAEPQSSTFVLDSSVH